MPPADPSRRPPLKLGLGGAIAAASGGALRWFAGGYASQLDCAVQPIALTNKDLAIAKADVR